MYLSAACLILSAGLAVWNGSVLTAVSLAMCAIGQVIVAAAEPRGQKAGSVLGLTFTFAGVVIGFWQLIR